MDISPTSGGTLEFNSISKFYGDQNQRYGGKLHWPGIGGLPFRGNKAPLLSEADQTRIYAAGDASHGTFDLSDPEDSKFYAWIRDRVVNGLFRLDFISRNWNEEKQNMVIYMEWTQLYTQIRS